MFVISIKSNKLKKLSLILTVIILTVIGGIIFVSKQESVPANNIQGINLKASDQKEINDFFAQFGWEINPEPCEIREIILPQEFDEIYLAYNEIQKKQGLDLEPFKGERVKLRSYEIKNYPGYENDSSSIRGNIIIYNGIVIAGDISNIQLDGFMHTLFIPTEESTL